MTVKEVAGVARIEAARLFLQRKPEKSARYHPNVISAPIVNDMVMWKRLAGLQRQVTGAAVFD